MTNEVKLKVLPEHKAQGIVELCWKNIVNPPNFEHPRLGDNMSLGERKDMLKDIRKKLDEKIEQLNREADKLTVDNNIDKVAILAQCEDTVTAAQIIDKYNLQNILELCKKSTGFITHSIAKNTINFPLSFEGDDVIVNCSYYEELSLDEPLLAEFLNIEDEQDAIEFAKKHMVLGNVCLVDLKTLDAGEDTVIKEPVFAHIDPAYEVDKQETVEV